jgi:hypothetical protein
MESSREFFADVTIDGLPLAALQQDPAAIRDRQALKEFLEYLHIRQGLLAPYSRSYPLIEPRELLPSFEKNFAEYKYLPSFSMVVFNRPLSYQEEIFQFDILHPADDKKRRATRDNLEKILPHLDQDYRPIFRQRIGARDLTDLATYEELLEFLFHMDRGHVIAKDAQGDFRLLGVYASFPSDLDTELKSLGMRIGKFRKQDHTAYERGREFVYQFLMELYGFPIAAERRTSAALFARKLSRLKEQYLIKVLGASDRTITSLSGFEQKKYPLVEKTALISLPAGLAEANPHLEEQGFYVDPGKRVVILKVTYQQHKYHRLNVLEDRALSILKQELIHPRHGGRDLSLNILKDTKRALGELTDIVRGEYSGSISYGRSDFLTSTKTHEDRLKFLSAWLTKNQRRLAAYGQESFEAAKKVLNSYLLNRTHRHAFARLRELHQEVLRKCAYLTQLHKLQTLERLAQLDKTLPRQGRSRRLALALDFMEAHREELPYYYADAFDKCINLFQQILHYPYFRNLYAGGPPPDSSFRYRLWEMLARGHGLVAALKRQHCQLQAEARKGNHFPLLYPELRRPSSKTA